MTDKLQDVSLQDADLDDVIGLLNQPTPAKPQAKVQEEWHQQLGEAKTKEGNEQVSQETSEAKEAEEKRLNIERMLEELELMKQKKKELIDRNNALKANQEQAEKQSKDLKQQLDETKQNLSDKVKKRKEEEKIEEVLAELDQTPGKIDMAIEKATQAPQGVQSSAYKKYLAFRPYIDPMSIRPYKPSDRGYYFKFYNETQVPLIRYTLEDNGFREAVDRHLDWQIMWSCTNIKSQTYQALHRYQKVNHFPKSTEICRKDCMYKHLAKLMEVHGQKHFKWLPLTFILPNEMNQLQEAMVRTPGINWIIKPASSSQGKGIFITRDVYKIPPKQQMIASQYVDNPLLIDGYKFDLRIYVCLASINPLRVYIYEDGLVRFATQKYQSSLNSNNANSKAAQYVHLTNYSLNKKNANFQNNTDAMQDGQGSKWSISALRKRLKAMGVDDVRIWQKIDDIVLKTIISAENVINNATEMFCPFRTNCFELFGFDILIDADYEPWLIEVNLCPALSCDSPLDQKIKSNVIADLFSLCGVMHLDERPKDHQQPKKNTVAAYGFAPQKRGVSQNRGNTLTQKPAVQPASQYTKFLMEQYNGNARKEDRAGMRTGAIEPSKEEKNVLKETQDENKRRGLFKRVFPCQDFLYYKQFFEEDRPLNYFVDSKIYGEKRDNNPHQKMLNEKMARFMQREMNEKKDQQRQTAVPMQPTKRQHSNVDRSMVENEDKQYNSIAKSNQSGAPPSGSDKQQPANLKQPLFNVELKLRPNMSETSQSAVLEKPTQPSLSAYDENNVARFQPSKSSSSKLSVSSSLSNAGRVQLGMPQKLQQQQQQSMLPPIPNGKLPPYQHSEKDLIKSLAARKDQLESELDGETKSEKSYAAVTRKGPMLKRAGSSSTQKGERRASEGLRAAGSFISQH